MQHFLLLVIDTWRVDGFLRHPDGVLVAVSMTRPEGHADCRLEKSCIDDPSLYNLCSFPLKLFSNGPETVYSLSVCHLLIILSRKNANAVRDLPSAVHMASLTARRPNCRALLMLSRLITTSGGQFRSNDTPPAIVNLLNPWTFWHQTATIWPHQLLS